MMEDNPELPYGNLLNKSSLQRRKRGGKLEEYTFALGDQSTTKPQVLKKQLKDCIKNKSLILDSAVKTLLEIANYR